MATWFTQSEALGVVTTLFWGSVLTSLASFLTDSYLHSLLKVHWKLLLVCTTLVLIWRIPAEGGFFHGLEYEDSYVYTVAGRQMAEQFRIEPSGPTLPYSINVECPAPFVPVGMREAGMKGAWSFAVSRLVY